MAGNIPLQVQVPPPPPTPTAGSNLPTTPTTTVYQPAPPPKPRDPVMGTTEETFLGSKEYYYAFGGEPNSTWTGLQQSTQRLLNDLCFRPLDPVSGQKSSVIRTKGLANKFTKQQKLTIFQKEIWKHLVKHGLDTISYLQDPHNNNNCLSVINHHARFISDMNHSENLSKQFQSKFDTWDKKHDYEARTFFYASLSSSILLGFESFTNETDSFATVWLKFIKYLTTTTSKTYDNMRQSIRSLRPQQFQGQNIESMAEQFVTLSTELDQAGHFDHNLTLNMVDGFLCAAKDAKGTFHHTLNDLRSKVQTCIQQTLFMAKEDQDTQFKQQKLTYKDVCMEAVSTYKLLHYDNMWEPSNLPKSNQNLSQEQIMLLVDNMKQDNKSASKQLNSNRNGSSNKSSIRN